jgi:glucose-6-phosphate 1-dehydrogenase
MQPPSDSVEPARPEVQRAPPCTMVIFGAGGDLTKRLLMPALYNLSGTGQLDEGLAILGVDHVEDTNEGWRNALTATMQSFTSDTTAEFHADIIDPAKWEWVRERLRYFKGDFGDPATFKAIAGRVSGNVLFYLAVPARFFAPIVEQLGAAGLLAETDGAFRRVIIEKPFGTDLSSAEELNRRILAVGHESQYFRIDHFLGKETVQSIMAIRFANGIFEPIWRREHVDHVQITAAETIGVADRGAFYEATGALRDMVPNHLFQLLTMTAMEPPNSFDAKDIRDEKAKLIGAVRPVQPSDAVRGQYGEGRVLGNDVAGYRSEPHVAPESTTETFAALRLEIDNWRWAGVPFYLRTGKRLGERRTEIAVQFKSPPYLLFRNTGTGAPSANVMKLAIDPVEGTASMFNVKVPGPTMRLDQATSRFEYTSLFKERPTVGYETLLYNCMMGDGTLFQRADSIEGSWAVVQPLLDAWRQGEPEAYAAGSSGPAGADALLAREGRQWQPLASPRRAP